MKLRKALAHVVSAVAALLATACSTTPHYPEQKHTTFFASEETVSRWTEVAAGSYLVPDSQVVVDGQGSIRIVPIPGKGGTITPGIAPGSSGNASSIADLAGVLRLKFAAQAARALSERIAARSLVGRFAVTSSASDAQVRIVPSVHLGIVADTACITVRWILHYADASGSDTKKSYIMPIYQLRPLQGAQSWTESNAAALQATVESTFALLSDVVLDDVAGRFRELSPDTLPGLHFAFGCAAVNEAKGVSLGDYGTHEAIRMLSTLGSRPMTGWVFIVDKRGIAR